jgi:hypothetical protein
MNPQPHTLSESLRDLAANSPQASPELGVRLREAFARHHAQRRLRKRAVFAVSVAACLAIAVVWLRTGKQMQDVGKPGPPAQMAKAPVPQPEIFAPKIERPSKSSIASAPVRPRVRAKQRSSSRDHSVGAVPEITAGDFIALPTFDPAVPVGESRMVRMDLPGSALQLIGYPVDGQLLDRRIVADVLVGEDGLPYAVRLVKTRNRR